MTTQTIKGVTCDRCRVFTKQAGDATTPPKGWKRRGAMDLCPMCIKRPTRIEIVIRSDNPHASQKHVLDALQAAIDDMRTWPDLVFPRQENYFNEGTRNTIGGYVRLNMDEENES